MTKQSAIRFESKSLRRLSLAELKRLRALTTGGKQSHLLAVLRERPKHARSALRLARRRLLVAATAPASLGQCLTGIDRLFFPPVPPFD